MKKSRLDELLVTRGLVETRSKAKALIMSGNVLVNDVPQEKSGTLISVEAIIRLREQLRYVGRGGLKLEKALAEFGILVSDKTCLDVGASTGGFSDCLLQHGAKKVYAIDSGQNQLHWKLKKDPRVVCLEKENFRYFETTRITDPIDVAVMDVSFISCKILIPKIVEVFKNSPGHKTFVLLIKPQFEVGKEEVGKGGIVREENLRQRVVNDITNFCIQLNLNNPQVIPSPITGADGNVEFLLFTTLAWPLAAIATKS